MTQATSYLPFESLYGSEPSDSNQTSSMPSSDTEAAQGDSKDKDLAKEHQIEEGNIIWRVSEAPLYLFSCKVE